MKISILGLGYVGTVTAACLTRMGHEVIGVDIDPSKVEQINAGVSPIIEKGLDDLLEKAVSKGRLRATTSCESALSETALSLICVGTPSTRAGRLDLTHVEEVAREIGEYLANQKRLNQIIVLRNTVLPGATEGRVRPIIEDGSGHKVGKWNRHRL